MAVSFTVFEFEIKGDVGRKTQIFTPPYI